MCGAAGHANADLNSKDMNGSTAISDKPECVRLLVNAKADLEAKCKSDNTALIVAAVFRSTECLLLLVDANADIEAKDPEGKTARRGCTECVTLLVTASTIAGQRSERKRSRTGDASPPRDEEQ